MRSIEFVSSTVGNGQGFANLRQEVREGALLYFVSGRCEEGFDPDGAILTHPASPLPTAEYVAIYNKCRFWCQPVFGNDLSALPAKIQGLLIKRETDWLYLLPLCGDTYKTLIRGGEKGLELVTYSGCEGVTECNDQPLLIMGEGENPFLLVKKLARIASSVSGERRILREDTVMPEDLQYLGWCSWDAFQIRVSHEGLLQKAEEFRQKRVPVRYAILDDMWGDAPALAEIPQDADFRTMCRGMHASKLRSFEGAPERFPKGMAAAVADLKAAGIPKVGVWFPTTGYWAGFDPMGEAMEMKELLAPNALGDLNVLPEETAANAYFDRLCGRIKAWGADFVKIDNQGSLSSHYHNIVPLPQAARVMQSAIDRAVFKYFDGTLINCMGMPSECMFHRPLSAVSRCSADFMPESPEWFTRNIQQCAFNGLLQGQFYINDWDMWWTDDAQALKNSVCRAVSGGPIYVSDKLGRTRGEVLAPLCFDDGRLLLCDDSALPTEDCLVGDPTTSGKCFKIFNRVGNARMLAAFDLDAEGRPVSGSVSPSEVGLAGDCVVYEHFSGEVRVLPAHESLTFTLADVHELRLYTLLPKEEITVIGRSDKFIGPAALLSKEGERITLYEGGEISFHTECRSVRVFSEKRELPVRREGDLCTVLAEREETHLRFVVD